MKSKQLILLTTHFPYGYGEPFLETEIHYLASAFEKVTIISNDVTSDFLREVPENCRVLRLDLTLSRMDKMKAYFGLCSEDYKEEKKYARDVLMVEMSKGIRNTMLVSLFRAKRVKKYLLGLIGSTDKLSVVCYSYWCSDNALGLAMLHTDYSEIKSVSRVHGWDLYFEASRINYLLYRKKIAHGLSELYPISNLGYSYIRERWLVKMDHVQVARLGTLERKMIPTNGKMTIVSVSNIIPLKRVYIIAGALNEIKDLEIKWVHFGGGESAELTNLIESMPRNIEVNLMGNTPNKEVIEWYNQNEPDLFINVSTTEGVPVSIMEAMSFGVPVMATDVGGTSEIVNDKNGYLLDHTISESELAEKILHFSNLNEVERGEKRNEAMKTWRNEYNADVNYLAFSKKLAND